MNAMKNFQTVSLEPHVSMMMEVSLVLVQLVSLEMAERVDLVVQVCHMVYDCTLTVVIHSTTVNVDLH